MRAAAVRSVCVGGTALPHGSQPEKNDDDDHHFLEQASLLPETCRPDFSAPSAAW